MRDRGEGAHVGMVEIDAFSGECVEVRCANVRIAVRADVVVAKRIRDDQYDIHPFFLSYSY